LEGGGEQEAVEFRSVGPVRSLAITDSVSFVDAVQWLTEAYAELVTVVGTCGLTATGPSGGLYSSEFFEEGVGDVAIFVPVAEELGAVGRVKPYEVPAADLAVVMHHGPLMDLDQSYGRLGTFVSERGIGADGPIRELYLVTAAETSDPSELRTEVGWPIVRP
jgi:effector-binding domain-containing protein